MLGASFFMEELASIASQIPTQDRLPKVKERIDRVGISGLKTALKLVDHGVESPFTVDIDLFIDLDTDKKGIHMSRLVESINDTVALCSREPRECFEMLGSDILTKLRDKHRFTRGEITIRTTMLLRRFTPVTNKPTDEPYDVAIKVIMDQDQLFKNLKVNVIGSTLCPHSLETTHGKAHVQRAEIDLSIEAPIKEDIPLEELVDICERSFSSPTYTVLKTVDEAAVVEKMFANPKFVEDVARDCLRFTTNLGFKGKVKIRAISYESIHKHNAISEIERVFN